MVEELAPVPRGQPQIVGAQRSGNTPGQGSATLQFMRGSWLLGGPHWSPASQEGVKKAFAKGYCRGRFQAGSVSQREGGNELFLVGGFHPNGSPNMGLQELEDCRRGPGVSGNLKAKIIPKLSGGGFLGRLLIITKYLLSSKLLQFLKKWMFLEKTFSRCERNIFLGKWLRVGSQALSSILC